MLQDACDVKGLCKVLFIASFSGCPRVWKMASTLAKSNSKVTILEWDRSSKLPVAESVNNISVYHMKLKAPYGSNLVFLLPVWWIYTFVYLLLNDFDVVQPQNLDSLSIPWMLSHFKRMKIVYDIADFYADAYIPSNMMLLRKAVALLEKTLIRTVDASIIVDESRLAQVNLSYPSFLVIYNSPPDIYEDLAGEYANELFSNPNFSLFYAGVLERDRGLEVMVQAVQDLDDVELVIAGFGRMEKEISETVRDKRNVRLLDRIPYNDVLKLTFLCDCVVALYDPSIPNNVFASPNKLFEAMMCAKPIIVSEGTAMATKVRKYGCGLLVNYGNIEELQRAIDRLRNDRELAMLLGKKGRLAYLRMYNWPLMERKFLELYDELLTCSRLNAFES